MSKAIRYKANGKYLQNSMFWTALDYVCAYHASPDAFDAALAAEEEAKSIASHKQDFALAFGIPADQIEVEFITWNGDPSTLPKEDESDVLVRLPVPPIPPPPPTLASILSTELVKLRADPALNAVSRAAIDVIVEAAKRE